MIPIHISVLAGLAANLLLPFAALAQDDPPPKKDPAREKLNEAIATYEEAISDAADAFEERIQTAIAAIPKQTGLSKEEKLARLTELETAREAFRGQPRRLPDTKKLPALEKAVKRYTKSVESARRAVNRAFDEAESHYEHSDIEMLKTVRRERAALIPVEPTAKTRATADKIRTWWPAKTRMKFFRTTTTGGNRTVRSTVIENDGYRVVIEAPSRSGHTPRLWTLAVDADGQLHLVSQKKKDPRKPGGVMHNCSSDLRISKRRIKGTYAYDLEQPAGRPSKRVSGKIEWTLASDD